MTKFRTKHVVVLLGLPVLLAFQNCSKVDMTPSHPELDSKIGGNGGQIITDGNDQPDDTTIDSNDGSELSDSNSSKIWRLQSYSRKSAAVELPRKEFQLVLIANIGQSDKVCAGDCGVQAKVNGQSFCGPLSGSYKERFSESSGELKAGFSELQDANTTLQSDCNSEEELLHLEMIAQLNSSFVLDRSEDGLITLKLEDGSQMVFAGN